MRSILVALILIILTVTLSAVPPRQVVRIPDPAPELLQRFLRLDADIAAYRPGQYLDLVVGEADLPALISEFPRLSITQTEQQLKDNLHDDRDLPGYRSYAQMVTELMQLQSQYPGLMQTSVLGTGWGGIYAGQDIPFYQNFDHQLWAVKVSANVLQNEDEPAFFFVGEHHAREPLSTEVCMGILIHLLENYGSDPVVTNILDTSEIWIVPLLNPDGHKIVIDQTDVWWRKNVRDNNSNQTFDHDSAGNGMDGVDLNRNYGYYWGHTNATDYIPAATYHGPSAFSEPETQAFRDFLLGRRFLAGIGYHTYGQYVLYPYGYVEGIQAPDKIELQALAQEMASLLPGVSGGYYLPGPSYGLYPVSGSLDDWAYSQTGAFSYTIEMATQFIPPASQVPQIVQHQVNGALAMMQRKNKKILRGHVTDAVTGAPLVARIYVEGFDDALVYRTPIRSDSLFGAYYYLLPPGTYNVRYICPGYASETRSVTIFADSPTLEEVALTPIQPLDLNILVIGDFYSGLEGVTVTLNEDPEQSYVTDTEGRISLPGFLPGHYLLQASRQGFETLSLMRDITTTDITLRLTSQSHFADDFEQDLNNWTTTGSWNRSNADHYYGSYCLTDSPAGNYQNNASTFARLAEPLDLHNVENANLQFWLRTEMALDDDALLLEYSLTGSNWAIMGYYSGVRYWTLQSLDLNSLIGNDLHLRFRLQTGSGGSANGVFIDGFKFFRSVNVTSAQEELLSPPRITLAAAPNPFGDRTVISLRTDAKTGPAELGIYNIRGQLVREFRIKSLTPGAHEYDWDGRDGTGSPCAAGIYLIRLAGPRGTLASARIAHLK